MQSSKRLVKHLLYFAIFASSACAPKKENMAEAPSSPNTPPSKPAPGEGTLAHGFINGKEWNYRQGRARKVNIRGRKFFEIQLWDQVFKDPCDPQLKGSDLQVRLQAEGLDGLWDVVGDMFAFFPQVVFSDFQRRYEAAANMTASSGSFLLKSDRTLKEVYGSLAAEFPSDLVGTTWVEGEFSVPLCGSR